MDRREHSGVKNVLAAVRVSAIAGLLAALVSAPFWPLPSSKAGVLCSLPFTLTNGTTADATQVMANYNAIITCLGNAAAAGVNTDINALNGLTTPIPISEGGTNTYIASGNSTGAPNAQVIASPSPTGFSLALGKKIIFVAGFSNTGATTLNVAGTGVTNLFRITTSGVGQMVGGEILAGQLVEAMFDGTQFEMVSQMASAMPPGALLDWPGTNCPTGFFESNSGNFGTSSFPQLAAVLGTIWGSPGGGLTATPDLRGRAAFGRDSGGSGRITAAGGNFDGTGIGNTGGQQNWTLTQAQLPSYTLPAGTATTTLTCSGGGCLIVPNGSSPIPVTASGGSSTYNPSVYVTPVLSTTGVTISSGGSGNSHPVLSNAAIVLKCLKG